MDKLVVITTLLLLPAAYFAGSVNFAILLFRWQGLEDPRGRHSGNPGVSNVYRQGGLFWAGAVLLAELSKSAALGWITLKLLPPQGLPWVALSLLIGNRWPCFHQFRGGKGIANFLGFCLPLISPLLLMAGFGAYLVVLKWKRTAFLASFALLGFLLGGLALKVGPDPAGLTGMLLCTALIIASHRSNIKTLLAG